MPFHPLRAALLLGLALSCAASPGAATPRCPMLQDNGYRPQLTAGRSARPLPRIFAQVIRDCLPDPSPLAGPVSRKLSVSPTFRFD